MANRPHGRYRLTCPVEFSHRGDEAAAQAASGAVRYDVSCDAGRGRWYLAASWKKAPSPAVTLEELRAGTMVAIDVKAAGARALVIEDLDFEEARTEGQERTGNRPSRGRRGRGYRRMVSGIPTAKFRDRLTQMASNAGLSVIVIDPAYTSRWSAVHWLARLREQHPETTGHHAAALVIGRRGLGHRARTRVNETAPPQRTRCGQPRHDPGNPWRPSPRKGNPPPHEANGSRQAIRPEDLTGPRQATRRPKTVRGRPLSRCSLSLSAEER